METERFEALIDAILAIIITIIVLEIPLASNGTWQALLDIKYEFIIYAISFMICFNFWNFNNNIFSIVNKVDPKIIWTMAAENFYVFFPQFLYGLSFIITAIFSLIICKFLKDADPGNVALQVALSDPYPFYTTIILVMIGIVIGYFAYPPVIMLSCLISILGVWIIPKIKR